MRVIHLPLHLPKVSPRWMATALLLAITAISAGPNVALASAGVRAPSAAAPAVALVAAAPAVQQAAPAAAQPQAASGAVSAPAGNAAMSAAPVAPSTQARSQSLAAHVNTSAHAPLAAPLPTACGSLDSTSNTRSCDLWAMTGTLTLADATSVNIWGFSATSGGSAGLPGPVLVANQGENLSLTLHNVNIPVATSLSLSQLPGVPDTAGVTSGNSANYSFTNVQPGTYLYEAGLTANGPRAVAMGLYGALVVLPTGCTNCAYDANSTFDDQAVVVLSEIDPAFNANPTTYNMDDFSPTYWLINGKSYPATDVIGTDVGHKVLLRYVNAGLKHHSMGLLGLHETILGLDAKPVTNASTVAAQTIPTGTTLDAIATIPADAHAGNMYALYDAAMRIDNAGALTAPSDPKSTIAVGGMLMYLQVAGAPSPSTAPVTSAVSLSPNPTSGSGTELLTATAQSGTANISAMEYFVDNLGPNGTGTPITGTTILAGGFGTPTVTLSEDVSTTVASLSSGNHTFYVHAQDSTGLWGDVTSAILNLDKTGPSTTGMKLTPNPTNGTADVTIQATSSDASTGNQNVIAAEYFIDPTGTPAGGTGTAMTDVCTNGATPPCAAPTVSLTATISAATVAALSEGAHTVAIRGEDAIGNWGPFGTITLKVDKTGPSTSGLTVLPSPTNGQWGNPVVGSDAFYEVVNANFSDPSVNGANSNITLAEYFIDTAGANGTGQKMQPVGGSYNKSPNASGFSWIQLWQIAALPEGAHTVYVNAEDAAGNWGSFTTQTLIVDKTGPTISNAAVTAPNPQGQVTLTATATDPNVAGMTTGSNIIAAEWFIGTDPGAGSGNAITVATPGNPVNLSATFTVTGFPAISVRAEDAAHNWGPYVTVSVPRPGPIFSDGFDSPTTLPGNWSSCTSCSSGTGNRLTVVTSAAAQAGGHYLSASISSGTSGYVQDNRPTAETTYYAKFYVNPNGVTLNGTTPITIFTGLNGSNATLFSVLLRRSGGSYQVALSVVNKNGTSTTSWVGINNNAWNSIEISWQSAPAASASLWVNNTSASSPNATISPIDTSANTLETVRLGPQGTLSGVSGSIRFDTFASRRDTFI